MTSENSPEERKPQKDFIVYRDGHELGVWPYDIVVALFRIGHLNTADRVKLTDKDKTEPLSNVIPPSPVHGKVIRIAGRENEDDCWVFYKKDASDVIGPVSFSTIHWRIICGDLKDDDLVFIAGSDRWRSVTEFIKIFMENEDYDIKGTISDIRNKLTYFSWPKFFQDIKDVFVKKNNK
jgi:hypothetical protein